MLIYIHTVWRHAQCGCCAQLVILESISVNGMCYKEQSKTPWRWRRQKPTRVEFIVKKTINLPAVCIHSLPIKGDVTHEARWIQRTNNPPLPLSVRAAVCPEINWTQIPSVWSPLTRKPNREAARDKIALAASPHVSPQNHLPSPKFKFTLCPKHNLESFIVAKLQP